MENNEQIDPKYKALIDSINKNSAEALVELMKLEIDKQSRSLIVSDTPQNDMILKGGIRTLERIVRHLDKQIISKKDNF